MTVVLLVFVAGVLVASALVMVALWVEDRAIDRTGETFDYGLTDDDAPRDDNDTPPIDPASFEAWMRKKYGATP